jgi:hypothetical protein
MRRRTRGVAQSLEESMKFSQSLSRLVMASFVALALASGYVLAQATKDYQPSMGQAGKDVIWIPTPQALVDKMLDTAKVTADDYVIDLGSGDGRTVITAAKRGAKALGIEYNPDMVEHAKKNAEKEGVTGKANFMKADIFESDFSQATVITMFLLSDLNLRLRPKILDMKPGTRIVSNTFDMGDWQADVRISAENECTSYCNGYFWVVPAKVEGTWKMPQGELALEQKYQMISGTLKQGTNSTPISDGKMTGDQIAFKAGGTQYTGKVAGNTITGTSKTGDNESTWEATRGN